MKDLVSHARSAGVRNPALDMFRVPPTDLSMSARRFVPINPFTTGINPIDFQIDPQEDFLDLSESYFEVELQLKNQADGGNLVAADTIFPVNNLAHSLFKQINVRLNGTLISPQTDTHHYKAYLEALIHNDRDDGQTILKPEGWINAIDLPDDLTANQLNTAHDDFKALSLEDQYQVRQLKELMSWFVGGNKVTLRFKPYLEVFHLSKVLPAGFQIHIQLYLNRADMVGIRYQGGKNFRLSQEDIKVKLYLAQVRVTPSIYRELIEGMKKKIVSYPTVRSEIRTYSHPNDNRYFECNNPFHNQIPNLLIVGLVEAAAFNGNVGKYPFSFKKFNTSSVRQLVRGEEYPYETLELQHDGKSKDLRGYFRYLQATGCLGKKRKGNMVRYDDWGQDKNCTLFVFVNKADGDSNSPVLSPKLNGELRVVISFGAYPGENLTVILYGEFENLLEKDSNRVVTYDMYQP